MRQRNITELSGGWKMKLALARAMLLNADILLLDGGEGEEAWGGLHLDASITLLIARGDGR